jgi:hypothetical protein
MEWNNKEDILYKLLYVYVTRETYFFLISKWQDCIRANVFRKVTAVSCALLLLLLLFLCIGLSSVAAHEIWVTHCILFFFLLNLYRTKYRLEHIKFYPTWGGLRQSTDQRYKWFALYIFSTLEIHLCFVYFEIWEFRSKHRSFYKGTCAQKNYWQIEKVENTN